MGRFFKFLFAFALCALLSGCGSTPAVTDPARPHHTESGFRNPHYTDRKSFRDFLRWRWERRRKEIPGPSAYDFPLAENDPPFLRGNRVLTTVTWIGQSTLLVQAGGVNILTDPHFSERASPLSWAGPKRVVPPGLSLEELPPIDLVLISHNHYDHLDDWSVRRLAARPGAEQTLFVAPLGLGSWLKERGARRVAEIDWWEEHSEGATTITAVPVQHWSRRGFFDGFATLWAGFVVETGPFRFFFNGDSGYSPDFAEIGRRLGPFDLAAQPIGAYEPRWFMAPYHMTPEEALQAHLDSGANLTVALHWGTFILTDEPLDEPPRRLSQALIEQKVSPESFRVLRHGETLILNEP
jgi:N-acyl-phosphatidylethanolamine-hydrolysing phospholipase D